jgi:hypothetical protein
MKTKDTERVITEYDLGLGLGFVIKKFFLVFVILD